jgi:hypothetical protein
MRIGDRVLAFGWVGKIDQVILDSDGPLFIVVYHEELGGAMCRPQHLRLLKAAKVR